MSSGVQPVFNLNEKTAQTVDLVQRLRPSPVPAFIVPAPTGTAPTTPTT